MQVSIGILVTVAALAVLILLRTILDFYFAPWLVRRLHYIPSRWLWRQKWTSFVGKWDLLWEAGGSDDFTDPNRRKGLLTIWQFGPYCYGEFTTGGASYAMLARIKDSYLVGDWYAKADRHGYFGALQMIVQSERYLEGKWIGHSKKFVDVRADSISIKRNDR